MLQNAIRRRHRAIKKSWCNEGSKLWRFRLFADLWIASESLW